MSQCTHELTEIEHVCGVTLEAGDISGFTLGLTFEYSAETCYTDDPGAECYYMSAVWYS